MFALPTVLIRGCCTSNVPSTQAASLTTSSLNVLEIITRKQPTVVLGLLLDSLKNVRRVDYRAIGCGLGKSRSKALLDTAATNISRSQRPDQTEGRRGMGTSGTINNTALKSSNPTEVSSRGR